MKIKRKIIEIDDERCDGCGQCVPGCAEGAMQIVDGKARMIAENLCDGLGACIGECPNGALRIIEREAEAFDEVAVEAHLAGQPADNPQTSSVRTGGCPSGQIQMLPPRSDCQQANAPNAFDAGGPSALTHWPIQIRLIPPHAPFLKGADLLVLADCCGVAYRGLHKDLLKGRVVMMGCPKFDDAQDYIERFTQIFKTADIRRITTAVMEVPCCSGLPAMVEKALAAAGRSIPHARIVVGTRGQILMQS